MSKAQQKLVPPIVQPDVRPSTLVLGGIGVGTAIGSIELSWHFGVSSAAIPSLLLLTSKLHSRFVIDSKVSNRAQSDPAYAELLRATVDSAKRFVLNSGLLWEFRMMIPEDPELPPWERMVLHVKPVGTSFEEAMKLWDRLDSEVRQAIKEKIASSSAGLQRKLSELEQTLFIEMDLGE